MILEYFNLTANRLNSRSADLYWWFFSTGFSVGVSDEQLEIPHKSEKGGSRTEFEYRLAWTRTYLKKYRLLENSSRGVWALTQRGRQVDRVDALEVKRFVQNQFVKAKEEDDEIPAEDDSELTWREELAETLLKMDPSAFERLTQRLLHESGFIQVEVVGRSGDGGIDGKGFMRFGGLLGFHVIFQCKCYRGSVPVSHVRDFRGAMAGRADKALLITTGNWSN